MRTIWRIKQLRGSHPISSEIIDLATLKICLNSFCSKRHLYDYMYLCSELQENEMDQDKTRRSEKAGTAI